MKWSTKQGGIMSVTLHPRFETMAWNHMDYLYSRVIRATRNTRKAEDIVQKIYQRAFEDFRTWWTESDFIEFINLSLEDIEGESDYEIESVASPLHSTCAF